MELREEIERILTENAKIMTGMDMDGNGVIEHEMYDEEEVDHDTVKNVTDELIKLFSLHRVSKTLPTDEEIGARSIKARNGFGEFAKYDDDYITGYQDGVKWIKDKSNES